ncbi:helix-turn-helix domain-containing protein [Arcanobacterium canis]
MTVLSNDYALTVQPDTRVGEQVRLWRHRRGKNQQDIAEMLQIRSATVSRKIAGKTAWSVSDLVKTAAFLNVSITDLLPEDTVEIEQKKMASDSKESKTNFGLYPSHLWESNPRPIHYE